MALRSTPPWKRKRGMSFSSWKRKCEGETKDLGRTWARMHHKVVGNFGSEADVRSLYNRRFRFSETSNVGACTHGRPGK